MLIDIKAFLTSARTGGFSAAAREINTTPSVITKRVNRLEDRVGVKLFTRSTRHLSLTAEGERLRPQLQVLVAELEDAITSVRDSSRELRGTLRIRCPTTVGTLFVGESITRFQQQHPGMSIDLILMDRLVNPLEEGLDISLGAPSQTFISVKEVPLCPYPRVLVSSPDYLAARGTPRSPADLVDHDCLAFMPVGLTWAFESRSGPISVDVRSRFTVNDSRILLDAAIAGLGLTVVPEFLAREPLRQGKLIALMPDFPVIPLWFKAMIPSHKVRHPEIIALIDHMKKEFDPPPWSRGEWEP